MTIVGSHSHLGGIEFLLAHQPRLLDELTERIESAESAILLRLRKELSENGWEPRGGNFKKERAAVEISEEPTESGIAALYPYHLAGYQANEIDVGVEILPTKAQFGFVLADLSALGRSTPAIPLVLIGIAQLTG